MAHALNLFVPIRQDADSLKLLAQIKESFVTKDQVEIEQAARESEIIHFLRVLILDDNINNQFYTIMRWFSRTDFSPLFSDQVGQDPIVGNSAFPGASSDFAVRLEDGTSTSLKRVVDFVHIRGVVFQLLPSRAALQHLAA
jgi:hypothetical protein